MLRGNDREWTKYPIPGRVGISFPVRIVARYSLYLLTSRHKKTRITFRCAGFFGTPAVSLMLYCFVIGAGLSSEVK